ncbi:uncharacterized protein MONOS_5992 [Monocercomonoides exilis]|uniref:uncharacterized protein n=1 Tax=Monocercomonoides exilis TaxID=2049356 RepID=UPI0035595A90|nr:hypothetical protein MONOS_5992 [Monocercomonoides exilis]|eukprot:MONOS_5992.1-p1 / transcript=MONOS_5992.1 / gene=MONOS_5992 / organism=Monocercomonoides_exilis_PA203 / gene_product=unspecified product / transcript_product=unspecified product / location=Mono_scaffold00182:47622-49700(+) / protein_length=450 / sequence_SO=supercontig / SO=protein_coding / is_pseudo=false
MSYISTQDFKEYEHNSEMYKTCESSRHIGRDRFDDASLSPPLTPDDEPQISSVKQKRTPVRKTDIKSNHTIQSKSAQRCPTKRFSSSRAYYSPSESIRGSIHTPSTCRSEGASSYAIERQSASAKRPETSVHNSRMNRASSNQRPSTAAEIAITSTKKPSSQKSFRPRTSSNLISRTRQMKSSTSLSTPKQNTRSFKQDKIAEVDETAVSLNFESEMSEEEINAQIEEFERRKQIAVKTYEFSKAEDAQKAIEILKKLKEDAKTQSLKRAHSERQKQILERYQFEKEELEFEWKTLFNAQKEEGERSLKELRTAAAQKRKQIQDAPIYPENFHPSKIILDLKRKIDVLSASEKFKEAGALTKELKKAEAEEAEEYQKAMEDKKRRTLAALDAKQQKDEADLLRNLEDQKKSMMALERRARQELDSRFRMISRMEEDIQSTLTKKSLKKG